MAQKFNPISGNFDTVLDKASEIKYDNSTSGLTATDTQAAVDEVEARVDQNETDIANKADRNLGNLTSPTAFNQSLIPDSDSARDIGSSSTKVNNVFFGGRLRTNADSYVGDGVSAASGQSIQLGIVAGSETANLGITGIDNAAGNTGKIILETGDATGGNSGNIELRTGTATGTRGTIGLNGEVLLSQDATASLGAVTKQQLDAAINGVDVKEGVLVATTANITLSGEQTIDGVLTSASRVLVKNQSTQSENGIYLTAAGAWTRTDDANTAAELNNALVTVSQGSTQANTGWYQSSEIVTLGSDNVVFQQFFGAGTYTADGQGIELVGSTFQLELDGSTLSKSASGVKVSDATLAAKANITLDNLGTTAINADLIFNKTSPIINGGAQVLTLAGTFLDTNVSAVRPLLDQTQTLGTSTRKYREHYVRDIFTYTAANVDATWLRGTVTTSPSGASVDGALQKATNSITPLAIYTPNRTNGSQNILIETGNVASGAQNSGKISCKTGDVIDGNSQDIEIITGTNSGVSGNSGNILVRSGASSGGTRGKLRYQDGSEGTAGYVLTSTDTLGTATWAAAPSFFSVNSISTNTAATANQTYIVDTTGGAVTVTLPAPALNRYVVVKDSGNAGTNNITVNPNAAETIDGAASSTISSAYGSNTYVSDGTNWFIV